MPSFNVTTTAISSVFVGDSQLMSVGFKNGSTTGILYLLNQNNDTGTVSSTVYDFLLNPGDTAGVSRAIDGNGQDGAWLGPWSVVANTGTVVLNVIPLYRAGRLR